MKQDYQEIVLSEIIPSPFNPRKRFDGPKMDELIASVKSKGVIEPVIVRPFDKVAKNKKTVINLSEAELAAKFELVAGERRWRAAIVAASENGGPDEYRIPALVRELTDDESFDLMMIENLQREDLNELEEAQGFQMYLKRKGAGCLDELAERCGLSARYIRRRMAVLKLPKKVLKLWEKGDLTYSHLEQFLRVKDDKELLNELIYNSVDEWEGMCAGEIKSEIDNKSPQLSKAVFDLKVAGCGKCRHNSDVQRQLFDLETDGKKCLKPACFKQQINSYLSARWEESSYFKDFGTCGFRFSERLSFNEYVRFDTYERGPWKACRSCEHFVTVIDGLGRIDCEKACLDPACCITRRYAGAGKKTDGAAGQAGDTDQDAAAVATRVPWHGDYFREKFYQTSIPQYFSSAIKTTVDTPDAQDIKTRLALFALFQSNVDLHPWFAERLGIELDDWYQMETKELFSALEKMDFKQLLELEAAATLQTILQESFGSLGRRLVANHIGIDLQAEFRIDEEYLQKKTKAEIIALAVQFGVFEQKCVLDFLFETLLKKQGKFSSCKKGELIRLFLESGADLGGVVPDEILGEIKESTK